MYALGDARWGLLRLRSAFNLASDLRKCGVDVKGDIMSMKNVAWLSCAVGLMVVITACSSAVPTETPGVERLGKFVLRENVTTAEVVLGYKYADNAIGREWLILELALTSPGGKSAKFERENIWVRTPAGVQVPAASQKAFGEAYGTLRSQISQADVMRDPMDYFPPNRIACSIDFFVPPGAGVSYDQVSVNDNRECQGKLYFYIPGGIQSGRYVLGMDLTEDEIRIPFVLGESN